MKIQTKTNMICPQCDAEYRYGFWTCSNCQVSLTPGAIPSEGQKSGTPALIAGLLIGIASVVVFLFEVMQEPMGWFVIGGLVVIAALVLFIRAKYSV